MQKGSGVSGEGELKIRDQRDFTGTSHVSLFHQLFTAGGTKYPLYMKPTTVHSPLTGLVRDSSYKDSMTAGSVTWMLNVIGTEGVHTRPP